MLAIDTHVVVRYLVADDAEPFVRAKKWVEGGPVWVATTVFLEAEWVLRTSYRRAPGALFKSLQGFATLPTVSVENPEVLTDALAWALNGLDFADALDLAAAKRAEAFVSFDRGLAKAAKRVGAPQVRSP